MGQISVFVTSILLLFLKVNTIQSRGGHGHGGHGHGHGGHGSGSGHGSRGGGGGGSFGTSHSSSSHSRGSYIAPSSSHTSTYSRNYDTESYSPTHSRNYDSESYSPTYSRNNDYESYSPTYSRHTYDIESPSLPKMDTGSNLGNFFSSRHHRHRNVISSSYSSTDSYGLGSSYYTPSERFAVGGMDYSHPHHEYSRLLSELREMQDKISRDFNLESGERQIITKKIEEPNIDILKLLGSYETPKFEDPDLNMLLGRDEEGAAEQVVTTTTQKPDADISTFLGSFERKMPKFEDIDHKMLLGEDEEGKQIETTTTNSVEYFSTIATNLADLDKSSENQYLTSPAQVDEHPQGNVESTSHPQERDEINFKLTDGEVLLHNAKNIFSHFAVRTLGIQ